MNKGKFDILCRQSTKKWFSKMLRYQFNITKNTGYQKQVLQKHRIPK